MLSKYAKSRKEEIALAAIDIISENGAKNLTMVKIAERIGVTDAALYKHFKSKNEILLFMITLIDKLLIEKINDISMNEEEPLEKLKQILNFQFSFIEKNKGVPRILFSEALQFEDVRLTNKTAAVIHKYKEIIKNVFFDAQKRKEINSNINIETLAFIFMGMLQSTVIIWSLGGCKITLKEKQLSLWENFKLMIQ